MPHSHSISLAGLFLACCFLLGCDDGKMATAPVKGTVTLDGEPVPMGTVTFVSETKGAPYAYGEIQFDGTFTMSTYGQGDGAVLGRHKIMISAFKVATDLPEAKSLLPSKYGSEQTSGLTAEVKEGENDIKLELTKK